MSTRARTFLSQEQSQLSYNCSGIKHNTLQAPRCLLGKQCEELEDRQEQVGKAAACILCRQFSRGFCSKYPLFPIINISSRKKVLGDSC